MKWHRHIITNLDIIPNQEGSDHLSTKWSWRRVALTDRSDLGSCHWHTAVTQPWVRLGSTPSSHQQPIMSSLYGFVKRLYLVRILSSSFASWIHFTNTLSLSCCRSSTLLPRKRPPTHPCDLVSSARRASHPSRSFIQLKPILTRW
jgi:hypothetical protein